MNKLDMVTKICAKEISDSFLNGIERGTLFAGLNFGSIAESRKEKIYDAIESMLRTYLEQLGVCTSLNNNLNWGTTNTKEDTMSDKPLLKALEWGAEEIDKLRKDKCTCDECLGREAELAEFFTKICEAVKDMRKDIEMELTVFNTTYNYTDKEVDDLDEHHDKIREMLPTYKQLDALTKEV